MFNSDFYPTPKSVYDLMDIDPQNKVVLEPSAGRGDLASYLLEDNATKVIAYEASEKLNSILQLMDGVEVKGYDFLESNSSDLSHIDMIVMNPPFSNAHKHIEHAFEIAPQGCEIISLCNIETIYKSYLYVKLNRLISNYGFYDDLGECFSSSDRKTNVGVALVKLYKPVTHENGDFDGFFMDDEEDKQGNGIMTYNEVRAIVNTYKSIIENFDKVYDNLTNINNALAHVNGGTLNIEWGYRNTITDKVDFIKDLQKKSWENVFDKMQVSKYVTSGVMEKINKFVETQTKIPFTMKNIYRMIEIIIGTREEAFKSAIVEAVDNFIKHTHENRWGVEGWKTNKGHLLNEKFIVEYITESSFSGKLGIRWNSFSSKYIDDLNKVLCNITGTNYDDIGSIHLFFSNAYKDGMPTNKWLDFGFFEAKFFKKGTGHFKFKDKSIWWRLNEYYGKIKGFTMPEKI